MKKYAFLFLVCCPLMAFGAPSVRALGANSISGVAGAKVTPTKASAVSADRGSSMARIGSLRAKATTVAAPSATSSSTSRFPVILPTKVYNTANAPRPTGSSSSSSTIISTDVDLSGIEQRIEQNKNSIQTNAASIATNAENISTNATNITNNASAITTNSENISSNTARIEALEGKPDADTILVSNGPNKPAEFNNREPGTNRAWIWVEQ